MKQVKSKQAKVTKNIKLEEQANEQIHKQRCDESEEQKNKRSGLTKHFA